MGHSRERIPGSVREENDGVGYRIYASINALEGEGGLGSFKEGIPGSVREVNEG